MTTLSPLNVVASVSDKLVGIAYTCIVMPDHVIPQDIRSFKSSRISPGFQFPMRDDCAEEINIAPARMRDQFSQ